MFDEPSSYLDIRQRLRAAHTIRSLTLKPEVAAAGPGVAVDDESSANRENK